MNSFLNEIFADQNHPQQRKQLIFKIVCLEFNNIDSIALINMESHF